MDELTKHDRAVSFIASLKGNPVFVSAQALCELYAALLKHDVEETSSCVGLRNEPQYRKTTP